MCTQKRMNENTPFILKQLRRVSTAIAVFMPVSIIADVSANPRYVLGTIQLLVLSGLWLAFVAASYGLWQRKRWARPFLATLLSVLLAVLIALGIAFSDPAMVFIPLTLLPVLYFYLYEKKSTKEYFDFSETSDS